MEAGNRNGGMDPGVAATAQRFRWSGEFADPRRELAFQAHIQQEEQRSFRIAVTTVGPLYFAFVISDYLALGDHPDFWINFVLRLALMLFCLGLAAAVGRQPRTLPGLHRLSLLFFLVVLADAFALYPFCHRSFLEIFPGLLVMLIGGFLFIPSRMHYSLTAAAVAITGFTLEAPIWFPPRHTDIPLALLFFIVALIFCVVTVRNHARVRRLQFLEGQRNVELAHYLQEEVGLRRRLEEEAQQQARTDELTGLANRRHFFEWGAQEVQRTLRYRQPLALIMFDLDHFKRINDTHGHAAGDLALQHVADCCRALLRQSDLVARLGGEEFAILLPGSDEAGAERLAERLRQRIAAEPISNSGPDFFISATFGVSGWDHTSALTLETLLDQADDALYRGKRAGRNRIERYHTDAADRPASS